MAQLPGYFEYKKELNENSGLNPFSYDSERKLFTVSNEKIPFEVFDPLTFILNSDIRFEGIPVDEITAHPALIDSTGHLIVGPSLHAFIEVNPQEVAKVASVMRDAYVSVVDDSSHIPPLNDDVTHMDFAAGIREGGGVRLQVFGNCACLEPDPESIYIQDQFEYGYAEYNEHNADAKEQRAALYAGMGHLATLTANS
jgi:hypothetical protein